VDTSQSSVLETPDLRAESAGIADSETGDTGKPRAERLKAGELRAQGLPLVTSHFLQPQLFDYPEFPPMRGGRYRCMGATRRRRMERQRWRFVARRMATGPHLLVVDDDEQKRSLLARFLRLEFRDALISQCVSGAHAIELLLHHAVSAIITDHSMHPVNGIELTRWVRARDAALPILMVTGHPEIASEALRVGVTRVMEFSEFREVGHAVRELLARIS
jgi:two-component system, chemotaxis family, chemotaxis protein CheY